MKVVGSRRVWSVREVTDAIAARFEDIPAIWLEGELHELRRAGGQVYFTLRGGHVLSASMSAALYDRVAPPPAEGGLVHARGRVEFFAPRARVSMRVERLEPAGEGLLRAQIAALRARLAGEGLIRQGPGRPLPLLPRRVALVTSPSGAARDDFLRNAWARFPDLDVVVVGTQVQGDGAPRSIARAIRVACALPDVEVVVVTRGGGSLDDLMAFNSDPVCRAVAACPVPVVSAVGHERDRSLCDEVADVAVSTPTAAAAAVAPSLEALTVRLADRREAMTRGLARARDDGAERLASRRTRLAAGLERAGRDARGRMERAGALLGPAALGLTARLGAGLDDRDARMGVAVRRRMEAGGTALARSEALLGALSPAATLGRGYAIVRDAASGGVVVDAADARRARDLEIELRDGAVAARVTEG